VSHDDGGMEDLRTELKGEHLHRLKQRAHDLGIPQEVIQEAEKDDVLKKAVFEHLIMEKEYGHEVDNHASPPPVYLHPEKNASLLAMPMSKEQLMEEMPISKLQLIDAATAHGMSLVSAAQYADLTFSLLRLTMITEDVWRRTDLRCLMLPGKIKIL